MKNIYILDQTLREGGYVNGFFFGESAISDIITELAAADIDMIECGFFKKNTRNADYSLYSNTDQLQSLIKSKQDNKVYLAMFEVHEDIPLENLCFNNRSIDGVRVSFHEHEIDKGIELCLRIQNEGYKIYVQPVGISTFNTSSLNKLICNVNDLNPYAFYIVDTLGQMDHNDTVDMATFIDSRLNPQIKLGFHSHNNMQMSFSNAITLMELDLNRDLIIDASIQGLGRGVGTVHTEMVAQYLNKTRGAQYDIIKILGLLDDYINPIINKYRCGYNSAYYFSAIHDCHPNYASYLLGLETLSLRDIYSIINCIADHKKTLYDRNYIDTIIYTYLNKKTL